VPMRRSR